MARSLSPAMRERSRFVGHYIREHHHPGANMGQLMRDAQHAFGSRGMHHERNPGGHRWLLIGAAVIGGFLLLKGKAPPPPADPNNLSLNGTGRPMPTAMNQAGI